MPDDRGDCREPMDAFSEVLSGVRLSGAKFFSAEFSAPWRLSTPHCRLIAPVLAPGAQHIVVFHFVVDGTAFASVNGGAPAELTPGDIVVFPHGDSHDLSAGSGTYQVDTGAVMRRLQQGDLSPIHAGGGGATTHFICGYLAVDPLLSGPILESLPPMLIVNVRSDEAGRWLEQSIRHVLDEATSERAGSGAMLAKLSEVLFVDTVRRHVAGLSNRTTGWLAAARDPVVGRSLALLHRRPAHAWTIAELARAAGLSRSTLVERFTRYLAQPPMTYLAAWRLRLAADALTTTSKPVAGIAAAVGYESEAAFNRAFKREFGAPPARFRRASRTGRASA